MNAEKDQQTFTQNNRQEELNKSTQTRPTEPGMQPISDTHEGSEATQTESERAEQRESEGKTTRQGNSSI